MHLTEREKNILIRCCKNNADIAKDLVLEVSTIKTHLTNLRKKFKSKNRAEILIKALKAKIITLKEVDCGFWNENDDYIEDYQLVDFSKE